ncbi:hypothetical protein CHELA20_52114 [Hyphomicrobiales bacterium]|nr:hypothetical protein CHELA41_22806 [Hyphomicrobiales bacterium]CAH1680680.1 hypothetical protein CHELA20_52114 [Hyphomicrobiales bacterium]
MPQQSFVTFELERVTSRKNAAIFGQENRLLLSRLPRIKSEIFYFKPMIFYTNLLTIIVFIEYLEITETIRSPPKIRAIKSKICGLWEELSRFSKR